MKTLGRKQQGDVIIEFVLVFPLIMLLFFCCIQLTHFWIAKQLLHYAAYSAARTTLVTNIYDYAYINQHGAVEYNHIGTPLHTAACTVMSWLEPNGGMDEFQYFPKRTDNAWRRVRIEGTEQAGNGNMVAEVTVHYFCPLWVPMIDELLAYALAGGTQSGDGVFEFPDDYANIVNDQSIGALPDTNTIPPKSIYRDNGLFVIHMKERCLIAKPYSTETYARLPNGGAQP
jgi:hypothetical protein